jgi:hypothetical protein
VIQEVAPALQKATYVEPCQVLTATEASIDIDIDSYATPKSRKRRCSRTTPPSTGTLKDDTIRRINLQHAGSKEYDSVNQVDSRSRTVPIHRHDVTINQSLFSPATTLTSPTTNRVISTKSATPKSLTTLPPSLKKCVLFSDGVMDIQDSAEMSVITLPEFSLSDVNKVFYKTSVTYNNVSHVFIHFGYFSVHHTNCFQVFCTFTNKLKTLFPNATLLYSTLLNSEKLNDTKKFNKQLVEKFGKNNLITITPDSNAFQQNQQKLTTASCDKLLKEFMSFLN